MAVPGRKIGKVALRLIPSGLLGGIRKRLSPGRDLWLGPRSIRAKLVCFTLALIVLITAGSSLVVIHVMNQALLRSLVQRGAALALGAATPAGYSILSSDRLALDNLAAKIQESQKDVVYLAIVDREDVVLAHSRLEAAGTRFDKAAGSLVQREKGLTVSRVRRYDQACYEFQVPIYFADTLVGDVFVGIEANTLDAAKLSARKKIFGISFLVLVFGVGGTLLLSSLVITPIKRLAAGVAKIKSGDYRVEVEISSRDELGELTGSFNEMSQVILAQKERLENYARNLEESSLSTVRILAAALDARDNYTLGHSARVANLSLLLGRRLGLGEAELKDLEMACFLHDIGKIRVPDKVLNKPSRLDIKEQRLIRKHPEEGARILRLAESLHKHVPVVLHHHEWYDGKGYPRGLKGKEIPLYAQIVAIADTYDAMTSSRPYRKGRTRAEATEEINRFSGSQFAPHLAELFIEALGDYEEAQEVLFMGEAI